MFGVPGCGQHGHHAELCCFARRGPALVFLQPFERRNELIIIASSSRLRVIGKSIVLVGALLQDGCDRDDVLAGYKSDVA